MALIIKDRNVVADPWQRLESAQAAIPARADVIVPLAVWRARREELLAREGRVGVWLASNEEPAAIADDLAHFGVVAVDFPNFGDGRGYSTATLLRTRYAWKGELRATGDIFRDQLSFLASCGFDAFELRKGEDPHEALAGFDVFGEAYQNSVERPLPLFRRRAAGP